MVMVFLLVLLVIAFVCAVVAGYWWLVMLDTEETIGEQPAAADVDPIPDRPKECVDGRCEDHERAVEEDSSQTLIQTSLASEAFVLFSMYNGDL